MSKSHMQTVPPEQNSRPPDGAEFRGPWMLTDEACDYLRYKGKHRLRSLYRFIARNGIPTSRRSARTILIKKLDLDYAITRGPRRPRHPQGDM